MVAPHYGYTGDDDPAMRDIVSWESPVQAMPGRDGATLPTLSDTQVRQWHEQRFLVLDGIWPADLIAEVR